MSASKVQIFYMAHVNYTIGSLMNENEKGHYIIMSRFHGFGVVTMMLGIQ